MCWEQTGIDSELFKCGDLLLIGFKWISSCCCGKTSPLKTRSLGEEEDHDEAFINR